MCYLIVTIENLYSTLLPVVYMHAQLLVPTVVRFGLSVALLFLITGCAPEKESRPSKPPFPMVTPENLFAVDALDQNHAWIVGFNATIVHTPDGGTTWEAQTSGVTVSLCDVSFVSPKTGWIAGREGTILTTSDGGENWIKQSSGTTHHLFGLTFVDESFGWAVGDFGTIIHTRDGGKTWMSQGSGEDRIYNDVCFIDRQLGWVAGEYGLIYHTADGGDHWELQECRDIIPVVDETEWEQPTPSLYSIWFQDSLRGWASGMDAIIITTEDGGLNWKKVNNPTEADKLTLYKIALIDGTGWAVGQKGTYLNSPDGGNTWEKRNDATATKSWLRDMDFSDKFSGWAVGARGTIIKTEDGGETWKMYSGIPLTFK